MMGGGTAIAIAKRYFSSKKSHSIINVMSYITIVAIAVPTAAMIILLSVHNGFEEFISRLWGSMDTPIVVEPVRGRYFECEALPVEKIKSVNGVELIGFYIEDEVLLRHKERQFTAVLRGVDENYVEIVNLQKIVSQGSANLSKGALVGSGLAYRLGLKINLSEPFTILAPSVGEGDLLNPLSQYGEISEPLAGAFSLDAERDGKMLFLSFDRASELLGRDNEATSLAVGLKEGVDIGEVKAKIAEIVGKEFKVKDINEQNELEYKLVKSEKIAIYLIIFLVMIVSSLTLVGTILMLITEKKESNVTLRILGVTGRDVRWIFINLGMLLSFIGASAGVVVGLGVSLAQQYWGFVPIKGASLLVNSYPIKVMFSDTLIVILLVLSVTFAISYISSKLAIEN